ncbi:MAG TPA: di-heme oxidoredictase family protein [Pyrinomonadaceae bacterium]|nr:di-heme oxidoredictase family protein [Pyrinomonadaceae bacterium]
MKLLKLAVLLFFATAFVLPMVSTNTVQSQTAATEAPTGFDNITNGVSPQGTPPPPGADPVPGTFANDILVFEEVDKIPDGLGPVYNAQACSECHQNPVTGGISQITELRAGHQDGFGFFVDAPGGSLINDRAINASIQERVPSSAEPIRTFRTSLNVLGDGFVEAIDSNTIVAIANNQPNQSGGQIAGQVIQVPVLEAPGNVRVGRFGWKNQQASLLSFASDAYLNEQGITNRLNRVENTSLGRSVAAFDTVPDNTPCENIPNTICAEDPEDDISIFARFMRSTKAPPRDTAVAATADSQAGQSLFNQIGCNICHVTSITTAPAGTVINGGAFVVPAALGNKIIHPYSDFLLHDVGTGDGIVQNGGQSTANKLRTPPLWGVRTRDRLMHDGQTLTRTEAITRHAGEATFVINNFRSLSLTQRNQIATFLNSL